MSKLKEVTWYGFDHEVVARKFEGNPKFIREFEIAGRVWAVYHCPDYDESLGHKEYMMLGKFGNSGYVSGRTKEEMQALRYQGAILCKFCDTVLHSMTVHDFHGCGCPNDTHVDGGRDYLRYLSADMSLVKVLTLDLLTGTAFDPETGEIYTYDK